MHFWLPKVVMGLIQVLIDIYPIYYPMWYGSGGTHMSATRLYLRKIVSFCTTSDEDDFYMKLILSDEIYYFLVLSFHNWDH